MRCILTAAILAASVFSAHAACYGSGAFTHCSDGYGNNYNIQRFGNSTYMNGYNAQTGNSWSQRSQTYGGTTYTYGNAGSGNPWSMTSHNYGNMRTYNGFDSNGQAFSYTCTKYNGCY